MCFPGQLLSQLSTETTVLSLGNRLWATMVWPLEKHGHHDRFQTYKLSTNPSIGGSFVFPFNPNDWVAADAEASLEEGVGVLLSPQRAFEPLPQAALRQSVNLTYNELVIIADALGVPNPVKLSRADLITRCCERLGDATFTEFVKSQEAAAKKKSKKNNAVTNVDLAASLLEGLDKDEAQEFSDIKTFVNPRTAMKRKWAEIKEEKKNESWLLTRFLKLISQNEVK